MVIKSYFRIVNINPSPPQQKRLGTFPLVECIQILQYFFQGTLRKSEE